MSIFDVKFKGGWLYLLALELRDITNMLMLVLRDNSIKLLLVLRDVNSIDVRIKGHQ